MFCNFLRTNVLFTVTITKYFYIIINRDLKYTLHLKSKQQCCSLIRTNLLKHNSAFINSDDPKIVLSRENNKNVEKSKENFLTIAKIWVDPSHENNYSDHRALNILKT